MMITFKFHKSYNPLDSIKQIKLRICSQCFKSKIEIHEPCAHGTINMFLRVEFIPQKTIQSYPEKE